jgi:hypothetical protein
MATLVNITSTTPQAVQVWGFHDPCTVRDVAAAVNTIAAGLKGAGHEIHIMSGTHGYCAGQVGAVATRDQRFAAEDRSLANPKTSDGQTVQLQVHDFNTSGLSNPDPVTQAMSRLNGDMRTIVGSRSASLVTFLLAYCCSAGTR